MTISDEIISEMLKLDKPTDYWICADLEFTELANCHPILQSNGFSVWHHTMMVVDLLSVKNQITLFAGLFHDLGKAIVIQPSHSGLSRFSGHEYQSAKIAERKLSQWGCSVYIKDRIVRLIKTHMFDISNVTKIKTIRQFVADVGYDNIENWFVLRIADSLSYDTKLKYSNNLIEPFRKKVMSYLAKQPMSGDPDVECSRRMSGINIRGVQDK